MPYRRATDRWTEQMRRRLVAAGWSPGRQVAIDTFVTCLEQEGYVVDETIRRFLAELGGLEIEEARAGQPVGYVVLDPCLATRGLGPECIASYVEALGCCLVPIGEARNGHLTLLMSDSGRVYAVYDDFVFLAGDSGEQALDTLCSGAKMKRIDIGGAA